MEKKNTKLKKRIVRVLIWSLIGTLVLATAHLLNKQEETKPNDQEHIKLKRELYSFWELKKAQTYRINKAAEDYIKANNLEPGSPLPPNTFYQANDPFWERFEKTEEVQMTSTYQAQAGRFQSGCASLITVSDKVPQPGERYAYCGILWGKSLTGSTYEIYPQDKYAMRRLLQANSIIEKKRKAQQTEK
jgi:hypothetical protein